MPHPKGGYRLKDGTRVPGVTTILSRFKESGALMWWACEQGKAIERGEISTLYDKRDFAAQGGTLAHSMVEQYIYGKKPPDTSKYTEETVVQATQGFNNFIEWFDNSHIKIIAQEMELVSEEHKFGGCPDAIGLNNKGQRIVLDWKTSSGIYTDMLMQVAAYKALWEEEHPTQPIDGGFHICRFSKEYGDFEHRYFSELDDAWEMFKLLRQAFDLDKKLKKRVK